MVVFGFISISHGFTGCSTVLGLLASRSPLTKNMFGTNFKNLAWKIYPDIKNLRSLLSNFTV